MNIKKTTWPFVLVVILLVALSSGFIFKNWGKKAKDPNQTEAAAIQDEKLAAQDEKIAELNRKIAEQAKLLAAQDKRFAELADITNRLDKIQADLNTRKVDINDSDMSLIQEMIEKQVKLNVRKGNMPKVGVVSIRKILETSEKQAKYMKEATAEHNTVIAKLEKLSKEIYAGEAGLKTLKIGSSDYLAQLEKIWEKKGILQSQEDFYKQQIEFKDKQWHGQLYKEILQITNEVAKEKGLDFVFEMSEPELPALSSKELAMTIRMHKLLYSEGCVDITDDVIAQLDSGK